MAISSFQKQFTLKKKSKKTNNFVKEMSKEITSSSLDKKFNSKFTSDKETIEKIIKILNN
jgi:hypothetical protein